MAEPSLLQGKTLMIRTAGAADAATVLENATLIEEGERRFVTGIVPAGMSENDWSIGLRIAIAWDTVVEITVVDDLRVLTARMQQSGKKRWW